MKKFLVFLMIFFVSVGFADENRTIEYVLHLPDTTMKVTLYKNKTWEITADKRSDLGKMSDVVFVPKPHLYIHPEEYGINKISLNVDYVSKTNKKIIGLIVNVKIQNPFGKNILDEDSEVVITLDKKGSMNDSGWVFRDNPFIYDELYDELLPLAQNESDNCIVTVKKVIFANGESYP